MKRLTCLIFLISFAHNTSIAAIGCCTVETRTIEEMPNESKKAYSVVIPNANYKIATKKIRRQLRSLSGDKAIREESFWVTKYFWWSNPLNDSVVIYIMVLPEEDGTILYAAMANENGWVDPGSGSLASYFSAELKRMSENIYDDVLKDKIKALRSDRKDEESDLKKVNKKIKKLRKKIVQSENNISKLENEITMLMGEQEKLITDISVERNSVLSNKGSNKSRYKEAKKAEKKLNKQLKKIKKSEKKNRKNILDHRNEIRNYEEEISKHQGTREHYKSRIKEIQQRRRDLRRLKDD